MNHRGFASAPCAPLWCDFILFHARQGANQESPVRHLKRCPLRTDEHSHSRRPARYDALCTQPSIVSASLKSRWVIPPAECVDRLHVTFV